MAQSPIQYAIFMQPLTQVSKMDISQSILFVDISKDASLEKMLKGAVNSDGTWFIEPAAGWTVDHLSTGIYRISHYAANPHYSVNIAAGDLFASPNIIQMTDMFFDVATKDSNANPTDAGFTFAMTFLQS